MGKYSDLAKQGVRYKLTEEEQVEQAPEQEGDGDFKRGFKKAMLQVPQTLGGTAALVGDLTGAQGLKEYGLGVYQNNSDKIAAITKDSDSLSNVLEGDASGKDWLGNAAGYVTGQAAQAILTGGVGGFIGSQLAKRGIAGVVARGANSVAAREVAGKVASRGAAIGAGSALLGSNVVQEAGSIYPEALHVAAEQGRELTGMDKARVVGSSLAAAGVDTAMDALMLGRVLKGARKPGESMLRAGVREIPGAMAREGVTEGIQTGIERYGAGQELNTADAIRDYVDSIGVGVVGGGMGGAASVLRSQKVPESGPLTRAANTAIEQQILQLEYDPQPLVGFPDGSVGTKAQAEVWLLQFPEAEREGKRRELMGRDPETGKRVQPEAEPEPTHAATPEEEAAHMAEWTAQHDPVDLDHAHAILGTPGAKNKGLMIAPHPDGGFTLVQGNKLTIDTQARIADLQKPVKSEAAKDAPAPAAPPRVTVGDANGWLNQNAQFARDLADKGGLTGKIEDAFAQGKTAAEVRAELKPLMGHIPAEEQAGFIVSVRASLGIPSQMDEDGKGEFKAWKEGYDKRKAQVSAPTATPAAEPEWKTNPYTAFKFADAARAEAFMVKRGADPALFEVQSVGDKFAIKRRAAPIVTEGVIDADNAVLAQESATVGGSGNQPAAVGGSGEVVADSAPAGQPGEGAASDAGTGAAVQPDNVRPAGGADTDAALTTPGRNSIDELMALEEDAGDGFKKNDRALAIIKQAAAGFIPSEKAKLTRAIKKYAQTGKDGITLIDPRLYEEVANRFAGVGYLLRDAIDAQSAPKEATPDVPQPAQVPEEAPAAAGAEAAAEPEAAPAKPASKLDQARAKHAKQDDAVAQAAANIAARKAAKEQANPDPDVDDGADIPAAFFAKVKVPADVLNEETGAVERIDVPADTALAAVREDIANLQALIKCMKGGK